MVCLPEANRDFWARADLFTHASKHANFSYRLLHRLLAYIVRDDLLSRENIFYWHNLSSHVVRNNNLDVFSPEIKYPNIHKFTHSSNLLWTSWVKGLRIQKADQQSVRIIQRPRTTKHKKRKPRISMIKTNVITPTEIEAIGKIKMPAWRSLLLKLNFELEDNIIQPFTHGFVYVLTDRRMLLTDKGNAWCPPQKYSSKRWGQIRRSRSNRRQVEQEVVSYANVRPGRTDGIALYHAWLVYEDGIFYGENQEAISKLGDWVRNVVIRGYQLWGDLGETNARRVKALNDTIVVCNDTLGNIYHRRALHNNQRRFLVEIPRDDPLVVSTITDAYHQRQRWSTITDDQGGHWFYHESSPSDEEPHIRPMIFFNLTPSERAKKDIKTTLRGFTFILATNVTTLNPIDSLKAFLTWRTKSSQTINWYPKVCTGDYFLNTDLRKGFCTLIYIHILHRHYLCNWISYMIKKKNKELCFLNKTTMHPSLEDISYLLENITLKNDKHKIILEVAQQKLAPVRTLLQALGLVLPIVPLIDKVKVEEEKIAQEKIEQEKTEN